jgi:hypothetical protein
MTEDANQDVIRQGMAAIAGAGPGRRRPPRTPAARPTSARRAHEAISYHPNDALALAIVRAWSDESFKDRLLTFSADMQTRDHERTRAALREMGIIIESKTPVVVTEQQFLSYPREKDHIVFVLPDPLGSIHTFANAQLAMSIIVLGM